MNNFWQKLPKPFFVLAPMKDVTDSAFRRVIARRGKPDVFFTEFVSADGLHHTVGLTDPAENESAPAARPIQLSFSAGSARLSPLLRDLQFGDNEHPIVAQIFSAKTEMIEYATKFIAGLGFDGVDINMGCPDRAVEKQGCGAAMIKNPELARQIIRAAKFVASGLTKSQRGFLGFGLRKSEYEFPVSVKTRVGYQEESLDEWLSVLLEESPAAITIHLRTRKDLSLAPANWKLMKRAVELRNKINPEVLLIGNGDVGSTEEGRRLAEETGCNGVMIGRAIFGNPWLFENIEGFRKPFMHEGFSKPKHGLDEKLGALLELAHEFEKISPSKDFSILKKHIKAFVTGFSGASALRVKLMEAKNASELDAFVHSLASRKQG